MSITIVNKKGTLTAEEKNMLKSKYSFKGIHNRNLLQENNNNVFMFTSQHTGLQSAIKTLKGISQGAYVLILKQTLFEDE